MYWSYFYVQGQERNPRMKERIALSIDKEVITEAKSLRINISEVAETALAAYVLAKKQKPLLEAYQDLFEYMLPLLKRFDCELKVAEVIEYNVKTDAGTYDIQHEIFLRGDGSLYDDFIEHTLKPEKLADSNFLSPLLILENLVNTLARNEERQGKRMDEIQMAKNIVNAICKTLKK